MTIPSPDSGRDKRHMMIFGAIFLGLILLVILANSL